jgi:foldase protein PrsA
MSREGRTVSRNASWLIGLAAIASVLVLKGCGDDVPRSAVATVDGEPIERQSFDHWLRIAAKTGGGPDATVPAPPDYANCDKPKRECKAEYEALRDQVVQLLVSARWIEEEASDRGIALDDSEVDKAFEAQKEQSFPNKGEFERFLKTSGQTTQDVLMRVRFDLLWNKIRDQVTKGDERVTDEQVRAYYERNRERFAQPERRDLRVVLAKSRADAKAALDELAGGRSWGAVANKYSIDEMTKAQGGKLTDVARGQQEKPLDSAIFRAPRGGVRGPVKTRLGYYVFTVTGIEEASRQTLEQAKPTIAQLVAAETEQKALNGFVDRFREKWRERTECRDGFVTPYCSNGPEPTATPGQPQTRGSG